MFVITELQVWGSTFFRKTVAGWRAKGWLSCFSCTFLSERRLIFGNASGGREMLCNLSLSYREMLFLKAA